MAKTDSPHSTTGNLLIGDANALPKKKPIVSNHKTHNSTTFPAKTKTRIPATRIVINNMSFRMRSVMTLVWVG